MTTISVFAVNKRGVKQLRFNLRRGQKDWSADIYNLQYVLLRNLTKDNSRIRYDYEVIVHF